MLYVYWFVFVFLSLVAALLLVAWFTRLTHEMLENVLHAVDQLFPDSSTYEISCYCEANYGYSMVQTYRCLLALEDNGVVRRFTKDGVYHKTDHVLDLLYPGRMKLLKTFEANDQKASTDDRDKFVAVLFWQITGRLNKPKRKTRKLSGAFAPQC